MIYIFGYIYKTTNLINKKVYIGQHKNKKFNMRYKGSGKLLRRAINKYGKENFSVEVIDTADSQEELNDKEISYIKFYKDTYGDDCYNQAAGGHEDIFKYLNEEQKQEFIDKMTLINRERCSTEEFKKRISEATSARYADPKERQRQRQCTLDYYSKEENRKKLSETLKEYYKKNGHDCSFNYKPCALLLNEEEIVFKCVGDLFIYMKEVLHYTPDRRMQKIMWDEGKEGKGRKFIQKAFKHLDGLKIYKLEADVTSRGDECSPQ